jgi:antitoxin YefM
MKASLNPVRRNSHAGTTAQLFAGADERPYAGPPAEPARNSQPSTAARLPRGGRSPLSKRTSLARCRRGTLARTMRRTSKRVNLENDIRPVSEFRANAAGLIDQVRSSGRPLVLTQRGHSAAVLLGVTEYEHLLSEIELLRDVREAEDQIAAGVRLSNRNAKAELRRRLRR